MIFFNSTCPLTVLYIYHVHKKKCNHMVYRIMLENTFTNHHSNAFTLNRFALFQSKTVLNLLNMSHTKQCCFLKIFIRLGKNNTSYFLFRMTFVSDVSANVHLWSFKLMCDMVGECYKYVPHYFQNSIQTMTTWITENTALEFEQKHFQALREEKILIG